jgi:3-oxoacid CoA-transferase subunit B
VAQDGSAKLLGECTLPLTGARVVDRVITDLCVLDVTATGFEVIELADGVTREQLVQKTEVSIRFSDALTEPA